MKGKLVYARKTSGGRCCSFKHKCTTMPKAHSQSNPRRKEEDEDQTVMNQLQGSSIKTVTNKNIPTNAQIEAKKPKMDAFARKLEGIKLKKRNITFTL